MGSARAHMWLTAARISGKFWFLLQKDENW